VQPVGGCSCSRRDVVNAGLAAGNHAQLAAAAVQGVGQGPGGGAAAGMFAPLLQQAMQNFPNLPHGAAAVQMVQVGDQPPMLFGPHGPLNAAAAAAAAAGNQQQPPAAGGGAGAGGAEAAAGGAAGEMQQVQGCLKSS